MNLISQHTGLCQQVSTYEYVESHANFIETVSLKIENVIIIFDVIINLRDIAKLIRRTVKFCLEVQDTLSDQKNRKDDMKLYFFEVFIWFEPFRPFS